MDLVSRVARLEAETARQTEQIENLERQIADLIAVSKETRTDMKVVLELVLMAKGIRWFLTICAGILTMLAAFGLKDWFTLKFK